MFATDADGYGGQIYPVTRALLRPLLGSFSLIPMIIAIYYAGELVWRERERRTHEIIDSTPVGDWAFTAPKIAAIALVLLSTLLVISGCNTVRGMGQDIERGGAAEGAEIVVRPGDRIGAEADGHGLSFNAVS